MDIGSEVYEETGGKHTSLGELVGRNREGFQIRTASGQMLVIPLDDKRAKRLTAIPF